jgi:glycosyltransferase involved in cell wall biosynthesis
MQRLLRKPRLVADIPLPGNPVESEADLVERGDEAPADHHTDGIAMDRGAGMVGVGGVGPATQVTIEGGPLTNEIAAGARSELEPNDYALRRRAMVRMLSGCDRVLAVSAFVGRMFESMGVDRNRLRTLPIGSRMPEIAQAVGVIDEPRPIAATGDGENRTLTRPLRLAFLGYHNFYKGLHVVCAALEQLPEQTRRQIDLAVHAKDVGPITPRLRQLSRTLSRVVVEDGYRPEDVPLLLRSVDLGLVPSVWWDNGPQTVLEFLSCRVPVLASCVGGIPDVIEHGRNGLLVPGNDPGALAREIERIVLDPSVLATLRRGITAPKSMATHATEIEAIYGECLRDAAL